MRIMYLLFSFTTGGTEKLVTDICNQMVKTEHDIHLYIVNQHYERERLAGINEKVHVFLQNRESGKDKVKTLFKISKYIIDKKIDIVHCNSFDVPELVILSRFITPQCKIVQTIHDVGQFCALVGIKKQLRNFICSDFIAISESVKQDIIKEGIDDQKVHVVYNAIDLQKFSRLDNRRKNASNEFVLGNVARIDCRKKGQDLLVEAVAKLKKEGYSIKCFFAGAPDVMHQEEYALLKKRAEELEIQKDVTFLGNVQDIPVFLKKLDIFVLPSRFEGFGISLIEALSMEIPCVACNQDGPAEIIGANERGLLFETGNVDDLVDKLKKMMDNYYMYYSAAKDNKKYVEDNFDICKMCDKLMEIYSK